MLRPRQTSYDREYPYTYSLLTVNGRHVVDIGAEIGSSAYYFLERGASHVTCFESDPKLFDELLHNAGSDYRVSVCSKWSGEWIPGTVLKMDIEGGESLLSPWYLAGFEQFAVALHPNALGPQKYRELKSAVNAVGGQLVFRTWDGKEEMYMKPL